VVLEWFVASLAIAKYEGASEVYLPNPASNYFTLNINTTKVQVFRWQAGSKSFDTSHSKGTPFVINDLSKGLYIVKALNENDEVQMMKFIKE
jgi:hypothetical protein